MSLQQSELYSGSGVLLPPRHVESPPAGRPVNVSPGERVVSAVAGAALLLDAARRRTLGGVAEALLGLVLLRRGATGHSRLYAGGASQQGPSEVRLEKSITVHCERERVYEAWRDFSRLPRFLGHVERVKLLGEGRSRWKARGPGGKRLSWVSELTADLPGRRISWATLPDSGLQHEGTVRFEDAPGERGTVVRVSWRYWVRGARLGTRLARLLGSSPEEQVAADLRRFKQLMEVGEVARVEGQPSGRRSAKGAVAAAQLG